MFRKKMLITVLTLVCIYPSFMIFPSNAASNPDSYIERKALFERMESITLIPWYYLAAMDQFERTIHKTSKDKAKQMIAIQVPPSVWAGLLNPDYEDENPASISFFDGIGKDGDGDGLASLDNDLDVLYSIAYMLSKYGTTEEDILIGFWEYYKHEKTVRVIQEFSQIYKHFNRLDLFDRVFPIPRGWNFSYRDTWGDARGWGGRRIHEGTDIFADYGTPVRSTCYGYVEIMGWNNYGGWRVGIRDLNNVYHYYAHLSGYNKEVKPNSIVQPGMVIGYVGSSGYGKPGTSGKFVPHLHFGLYKFNGRTEWAFDPYPHLKLWEREERKKNQKK